ncbi:nucleotidyltransferase family protein [Peribacillus sp. B-H-3]|uniref:nucleotidyltransferase domain-containing protein n=1 Tax=Peribacillus sp. B-H-3 TaxID=3400420 RepID=UPI003B01345E
MENNFNLENELFPNELKLLLEILAIEKEEEYDYFSNYSFREIDWKLFLQLVMHHRVYPIIYLKLKTLDEKIIPQFVILTLYKEYQKNTYSMLALCREMEQISNLFTENHIPILFLKGPVIAADIYGDISLRTSKDLDILVPMNTLHKADKLLLSFGFGKTTGPYILNEWKWRTHHIVYFHPERNIQLEIHWRLQPLPSSEPGFNELWERKRVSTITSYPVYFLGKEDLFFFLISHGSRHAWSRLRWLLDIDKIVRSGINLNEVNLLLKNYQSIHLVGQALILASQLLKTPINEEMKLLNVKSRSKELAHKALFVIKDRCLLDTNYYKHYCLSLNSTNLQKIYSFMLLFYPNSADAMTLRLPKSLHFLYFPLRPFLWVFRKTRVKPGISQN